MATCNLIVLALSQFARAYVAAQIGRASESEMRSYARLAIEPLFQYICTADKQPRQTPTLLRAGT